MGYSAECDVHDELLSLSKSNGARPNRHSGRKNFKAWVVPTGWYDKAARKNRRRSPIEYALEVLLVMLQARFEHLRVLPGLGQNQNPARWRPEAPPDPAG